MALYSPAYVSTRVTTTFADQSKRINYDRNRNFCLYNFLEIYNSVNNAQNGLYWSNINIYPYDFFINSYSLAFNYIKITTQGFVSISRNGIVTTVPINPNSLINNLYFYYAICISGQNLGTYSVGSTTAPLNTLFQNNNSRFNPLFQNLIFQNFANPYSTFVIDQSLNMAKFEYDMPLEYIYSQYNKGIYAYFIIGVGQPNFNKDLSLAGNGLLDLEFIREAYTPVLPANYFFDSGSSNYGSNYVQTPNATGAPSAKIVNWYYTINCQLYGKILS